MKLNSFLFRLWAGKERTESFLQEQKNRLPVYLDEPGEALKGRAREQSEQKAPETTIPTPRDSRPRGIGAGFFRIAHAHHRCEDLLKTMDFHRPQNILGKSE